MKNSRKDTSKGYAAPQKCEIKFGDKFHLLLYIKKTIKNLLICGKKIKFAE